MFERVGHAEEAFARTLQGLCHEASKRRALESIREHPGVFLEQLADHVAGGWFAGVAVYFRFGCPSWLAQVLHEAVKEAESLSGLSALELSIARVEARGCGFRVLAESGGNLGFVPYVRTGREMPALPAGIPEAMRLAFIATHAEWVTKAFPPRKSVVEAVREVPELCDAATELLHALLREFPSHTFLRSNSGRYCLGPGRILSLRVNQHRNAILFSVFGSLADFEGEPTLELRSDGTTHSRFVFRRVEQSPVVGRYLRRSAELYRSRGDAVAGVAAFVSAPTHGAGDPV